MDLGVFKVEDRADCKSCGRWMPGIYRIPGISGTHCSIACIETELFGEGRCRWCGRRIAKPYTSIESRLCSEDCRTNYFAYVKGDRSAALGTGVRLIEWLCHNAPDVYAKLSGEIPAKKLGRPPMNHHTMTGAERVREFRARKAVCVTKVGQNQVPAIPIA